ncbi:hypothetical protein ADL12_45235 [Streptomyces regalis]|uniref:L-lysine N6-monooxygenase MbtG n=2 Tax=Streptomyces regalis TaxID=68262 RepID=A0A101J6Z6_9ACTN|nr:hypothetical protein ADL12_45235 [Streptomyces regalis]
MDVMDVIGIGFGPSNIALAIALEESGAYDDWLFLEGASTPVWQEEMLFDISLDTYSNIQNIPYRDLVTPRNPRSRYTFLNYLVENDLLFSHLNMDMLMPLRPDYAKYIQWVTRFFEDRVRYGRRVEALTYDEAAPGGGAYRLVTNTGEEFLARHVVIGTGRLPKVPSQFAKLETDRIVHQSSYQSGTRPILSAQPSSKVAVIGSSQSAAEIILHLSKTYPQLSIDSIMRRYAFPLKDTSPFMSEAYFPEFTDMYYESPVELRRRIDRDISRTNYGACDMDVLEEIYRQMYYDRLHGRNQIHLRRLTDIVDARVDNDRVELALADRASGETRTASYDLVILATGFSNIGPGPEDLRSISLLDGLSSWLDSSAGEGHVDVDRGYAIDFANQPADASGVVVLNGLCERTHGIGDGGSLSLTSIRSADILRRLRQSDEGTAAPVAVGSGMEEGR